MWSYTYSDELYHHGIKGQKWGVRRYQKEDGSLTNAGKKHRQISLNPKVIKAQIENQKVKKGFENWKKSDAARDKAIALGKDRNARALEYELNRNKDTRKAYKQANKAYKLATKENTLYRRGVVKQTVGRDLASKYQSAAKRSNDTDAYNRLMNKHDIELASARKALPKAQKQSQRIANLKRARTMALKSIAGTAALAGGAYVVNKILKKKGIDIPISLDGFERVKRGINGGLTGLGIDMIKNAQFGAQDWIRRGLL